MTIIHLITIASLIGLLALLAWQDFKELSFHSFLIPLLFLGYVLKAYLEIDMYTLLEISVTNLMLIVVQLVVLIVYFKLRYRQSSFLDKFFGLGDLLMMFLLIAVLHPTKLLVFEVGTLLLTVIGAVFYSRIRKNWEFQIPLAGIWAVALATLILLEKIQLINPLLHPTQLTL